jgi:hypothetical protein
MTLTHTLTGRFQRQTLTRLTHPYGVPGIERECTLTHTLTTLTHTDPYVSGGLYIETPERVRSNRGLS